MPVSEYDKAGDFYFDRIHEGDPTKDDHIAPTLELLGDVAGRAICDLACGEGFFTRLLAQRGARVTGVDLSANLIGHARRQAGDLPIAFIQADTAQLDMLTDNSFDAVVCNMALMDIEDLEGTLQSVQRLLRREGVFIFTITHPCFNTPFETEKNPPHEIDEAGNFVALRVTNYGAEGKWYSGGTGMRGTFGAIHRTLSTYINALCQAGLFIEQLVEPMLPPGEYASFGEQRKSSVPGYLIAKTVKG